MRKRITLKMVKVAAAIAALMFWFCPLSTGIQVLIFVGSIIVLLICVIVSSDLDDDNDTGYWPPKPSESREDHPRAMKQGSTSENNQTGTI